MGAKSKLNALHLEGALIVAGLIGLATGSFPIFLLTLAGLLAVGVVSGDIRRWAPRAKSPPRLGPVRVGARAGQ